VTGGRTALFLLLGIFLAAIVVGLAVAWNSSRQPIVTPLVLTAPIVIACHSSHGLPDPLCTPGAADPRVTQDDVHSTICVSGYTATVRPPSSYTDSLKRQQISAYGYSDTNLADYEEDHLIPLELAGSPTDAKNLWPEPRTGDFPASKKDTLENSLHAKVCAGVMTLAAAQAAIATNWESISA
jgi:hypothetical protein